MEKNKTYLPAEWHYQNMVQVVFPCETTDWYKYLDDAIDTFINIVKSIQPYQKVLIIASKLNYIKSLFPIKKNLIFVKLDYNDTWSRDFGGITMFRDGKPFILDFTFNAWGKKFPYELDNQITRKLKLKGVFREYNHQIIPFVLEGGAIDSNGNGVLLTSSKTLLEKNRNPKLTKNTIDKKLKQFFNLKDIIWLEHGALEGDDTDSHIDTLARFVSEDTIVYQTAYKTDKNYTELKKMEKELISKVKKYNFRLIPLPPISPIFLEDEQLPATYVNFLITNKAVLVPIYQDKNDKKTLGIFDKLFPTRKIIPIDATTLIKQHGSVHCVTMQYHINTTKGNK